MTYPINALYGSGYSYNPVSDGYADATTADTVQKMNALYAGPGGALRSLRNMIPQGSEGLSILNMARSGLGTAANWLQGTPEIGPDTLAPLGAGIAGAAIKPASEAARPNLLAKAIKQHMRAQEAKYGPLTGKKHLAHMAESAGIAGLGTYALHGVMDPASAAVVGGFGVMAPHVLHTRDVYKRLKEIEGANQAPSPRSTTILADNSSASAPGVVVNSLAERSMAPDRSLGPSVGTAKPELGTLITEGRSNRDTPPNLLGRRSIAEIADPIRQSEETFVKAYRENVEANKHRYFDDWVEGEPIFDKDGNITDIPQTSARYEAASPYGASALEIVPAAAQAINAAARATGRDLYLSRALNTASHYGTLRTPSGKEHRVRVSDHARTSAQFDRPDFNIAPGAMTPEEFVRLLPTLRADNSRASAPGLAANSTQQSSDSGVLDILRKYGLPVE